MKKVPAPVATPGDGDGGSEATAAVRSEARLALRRCARAMQQLLERLDDNDAAAIRDVKRAVQSLVDVAQEDVTALLLERSLCLRPGGLPTHATQVAVLSLAMGCTLGLAREALYELALAGILHDIGKQRLPASLVDKPGSLTASEWEQMRQHPREGLVALLGLLQHHRFGWRPMLAAYEHHMKIDASGYPQAVRPRQLCLYSRIVAVADVYDAVTSPRGYRARSWPPPTVLHNMCMQPAWGLDRTLVKVLVRTIGWYPLGSVLQFPDASFALVTEHHADAPQRPTVCHIESRKRPRLGGAWDLRTCSTPVSCRVVPVHELPFRVDDLVGSL